MDKKILFYQSASGLVEGLTLADYELQFYNDNAGKTIIDVEIDVLADDDVIAYSVADGAWINKAGGTVGPEGPEGPSAYEVAVDDGFVGTEAAWLESLVGAAGSKGDTGNTGATGAQGAQGDQGIQGIQGIQGDTGATGPTGDTGATGPQGDPGVVAATSPLAYNGATQTVSLGSVTWGDLSGA